MADLRKHTYSMFRQNNYLKNSEIGRHFVKESCKRRTIYDIRKRYEIGLPTEDLTAK